MNNPLVTVNILSFNRKNELRITLNKVFEHDYKNIEVIVVDNASSDGTQEMVKTEFPEVKLIELDKNIGIAGWNKGFEAAKGEYVLVLDDDSYPEKNTIETGVKHFETDNKIAVVGFTVYNSFFNLIENFNDFSASNGKLIDTTGFIGCGALIRKDVFCKLGGYEEAIFLYYNELEFSIRAINEKYRVVFEPNHKVIHFYSLSQRNKSNGKIFVDKRRYEHTFKSFFVFLFLHFDLQYFLKYFLKLILSRFYIALKLGYLSVYWKTLFNIPLMIIGLKGKRKPVSREVQKSFNYGNFKFKDIYVYYAN